MLAINPTLDLGVYEALIHTGISMGIVFVVLIAICFVIYLLKFVPGLLSGENKKKKQEAKAATEKECPIEVSIVNKDTQLVAVIAAAIAAQMTDETGIPISANGLVIRSIKKRTMN